MSDYIKPTLYTGRGLENQLKNCIFNVHDLCCGCPKPLKHLQHLFNEECRHSATTTENGGPDKEDTAGEDFHLDAGDLEQLFDVEEKHAG